jgi:hypothetical protein
MGLLVEGSLLCSMVRTLARLRRLSGSQSGSHQPPARGDCVPRPATISAARPSIEPYLAASTDASDVPSKQRVAGSNPARRASPNPKSTVQVGLLVGDLHDAFRWWRVACVPERSGLAAGLPSAALAFLPTSLARARLAQDRLWCPAVEDLPDTGADEEGDYADQYAATEGEQGRPAGRVRDHDPEHSAKNRRKKYAAERRSQELAKTARRCG